MTAPPPTPPGNPHPPILDYETPRPKPRKEFRWVGVAVGVVVLLLAVAVLFPMPSRPKKSAMRAACRSNLTKIGTAMMVYANAHNGCFPASFPDLLVAQDLPSKKFVCPSSSDFPALGADPQTIATNLTTAGHLSYIYLAATLTSSASSDTILAIEPLTNHHGDGANALFADGHVQWLRAADAKQILSQIPNGPRPVIWPTPQPTPK